jgi:neutral ceramidase
MLRKAARGVLLFLGIILIFLGITIAPIDDRPLNQFEAIKTNTSNLDVIKLESTGGVGTLKAGWASVNITPQQPIHMAGYGRRGPYTAVADSLFARTVVFDNGVKKTVVISLDLLMFPRVIKARIQEILINDGYAENDIFLTATHTHNAFGNWEKSTAGELIFGGFDQENVEYLTKQVIKSINKAGSGLSPVQTGFQKIDAHELVENRLAPENGSKDPYLRMINLRKESGEKAMIISFSGHAVNLDADIWELSRDYPGVLVDELEHIQNIDFVMFCAGMVGSHNIKSDLPKGRERIMKTGQLLAHKIEQFQDSVIYNANSSLGALDIEILMPPSQLRITKNLRLRDWIFSALLGDLQANIKVMEIGNVLMIGMPCDYSGELSVNYKLDQFAKANKKELFITSFNGNYIGYITEDAHYYTCDHDEVKSLNWVGPSKGAYFTEIIKKIIAKSQE